MRLTKDNIDLYIDNHVYLDIKSNKEITHIDYIPNNVTCIDIDYTNVEEITCDLPEGLDTFYCYESKLKSLPLLPKSLDTFDGRFNTFSKEFNVLIVDNIIRCNQLRKLQLLELI